MANVVEAAQPDSKRSAGGYAFVDLKIKVAVGPFGSEEEAIDCARRNHHVPGDVIIVMWANQYTWDETRIICE